MDRRRCGRKQYSVAPNIRRAGVIAFLRASTTCHNSARERRLARDGQGRGFPLLAQHGVNGYTARPIAKDEIPAGSDSDGRPLTFNWRARTKPQRLVLLQCTW